MNFETDPIAIKNEKSESEEVYPRNNNKVEKLSFYVLLAVVILSPIIFWASPYISLDLIKAVTISLGTIVSALLIAIVAFKERKLVLPPKSLWITGVLLLISIMISTLLSLHIGKSFIGQGFELGSASFVMVLFLSGLVTFVLVSKQRERAVVLLVGVAISYIVLFIVHLLRVIFGSQFMTLGIMTFPTSSIIGGWYNLTLFSAVVLIISLLALVFLKLSPRIKVVYWLVLIISALGTIFTADTRIWNILLIVLLGINIYIFAGKFKIVRAGNGSLFSTSLKSISWLPFVILLLAGVFVVKGPAIVGPIITKANLSHIEVVLPWQMTLNVTASTIQNYPLFGVGPNNFSQAYLAFKPAGINNTNVWATEFPSGFGFIPTFATSAGVIGSILWILLFVFFGIISAKILRFLSLDSEGKFLVVTSFFVSVLLWLASFMTVPSHALMFFTFVFTGIFIALAYSYGLIPRSVFSPNPTSRFYKIYPSVVGLSILILCVWGLVYVKKTMALTYFGNGIKVLNVLGDPNLADKAFTKALRVDESDVFWRAKAETALVYADKLAQTVTPALSASSTQAILTEINSALNKGLTDAKKAIEFDPSNYYNYLSEARISEAAANVKMQNGYENAVNAYKSAINANPYNPSLYLYLANLHAKQAKYDDAIATLGQALQIKNNYLDAVFLLSQVYATKGDIQNAIIAAKVAVGLNPQNPIALFQLGLLAYNYKDYTGAVSAFEQAVKYQPDYANAKYFLGLALARLNQNEKALAQFESLSVANPDNQELALIVSSLKSGKSIFNDTPVKNSPEKRPNLPIKEKR